MCLVGTFIITHGGRFVKKKEINLWTIRSLCGIIEMRGGNETMKLYMHDRRTPLLTHGHNGCFIEHYHYAFEFFYMIHGEAEVRSEGNSYRLTDGGIYVAFPFVGHEYIVNTENESMVGIFYPSDIPEYSAFIMTHKPVSPVVDMSELPERAGDILLHLERVMNGGKRCDDTVRRCLLTSIVGEMSGAMDFVGRSKSGSGAERLVAYCMENYSDPDMSVEAAATALGFNRCYISRLLSSCFGTGFNEFVNSLRVDKARAMAAGGDTQIQDIAFECGFRSQRSFNRVFREFTGMTPTDFRARWYGVDKSLIDRTQ